MPLPLPITYKGADGKEPDNEDLVATIRAHCDAYFKREVKPHWPDAWIDYSRTRVGYEIAINRYFYAYKSPRDLDAIETDIEQFELAITEAFRGLAA